jgi:probable DNA metabolism protein
MRISLEKLFSALSSSAYVLSDEKELFDFGAGELPQQIDKTDIYFTTAYFSKGFNISLLEGTARNLFDLSFDAFDIILHAWMSELPVEREIISFGRGILTAVQSFSNLDDKRRTVKKIINDRGNVETQTVLNTAAKVQFEVHRMMGLLRFSPNKDGEFIAKCEPDNFILPCLGEYFSARFGDTPWEIIDEKRKLSLSRRQSHGQSYGRGEQAKIRILYAEDNAQGSVMADTGVQEDEWETLWKHYHKTINNEDRDNPGLQRQLMPKRYWKYLPEM